MWIARDLTGRAFIYSDKPKKGAIFWHSEGDIIALTDSMAAQYPEVRWDDDEPIEIKDI